MGWSRIMNIDFTIEELEEIHKTIYQHIEKLEDVMLKFPAQGELVKLAVEEELKHHKSAVEKIDAEIDRYYMD